MAVGSGDVERDGEGLGCLVGGPDRDVAHKVAHLLRHGKGGHLDVCRRERVAGRRVDGLDVDRKGVRLRRQPCRRAPAVVGQGDGELSVAVRVLAQREDERAVRRDPWRPHKQPMCRRHVVRHVDGGDSKRRALARAGLTRAGALGHDKGDGDPCHACDACWLDLVGIGLAAHPNRRHKGAVHVHALLPVRRVDLRRARARPCALVRAGRVLLRGRRQHRAALDARVAAGGAAVLRGVRGRRGVAVDTPRVLIHDQQWPGHRERGPAVDGRDREREVDRRSRVVVHIPRRPIVAGHHSKRRISEAVLLERKGQRRLRAKLA